MNAPVIKVEELGKEYVIGGREKAHATFRDMVSSNLVSPFRRFRELSGHLKIEERFWALKGVSFEVMAGEVVGIIGRNGAGKSTLLKILSRITAPTSGRVELRGRTASLLEIGTGFHPELTGRENIYLNGAILGMTLREIDRKFDQIVDFAEVDRFLETPVKRYSSGMHVRLAFAVAAHLEPEILIVDEVLAVGDFEFQRRCLGKMSEVALSGRTVLFVSHNINAIEKMCPQSILLKNGRIDCSGPTQEVIAHYLSSGSAHSAWQIGAQTEREGSGSARITRVELLAADTDLPIENLIFRQSFRLRIHYFANKRLIDPRFGFALLSDKAERVFQTETTEVGLEIPAIEIGHGTIDCLVSTPNLLPGLFFLEVWIIERVNLSFADHLHRVGRIEICLDPGQGALRPYLTYPARGRVFMDCRWSRQDGSEAASVAK